MVNVIELAQELNQNQLAQAPWNERVTSPVVNVDFFGEGRYRSIAYILDSEQLLSEHSYINAREGTSALTS